MKRLKVVALGLIAALVVVLGAGCTMTEERDLEGVPLKDPDKAEMYANINKHPNIVRLCIDGVAFATVSKDYSVMESITRVPEWDNWCKM